MKRSLILGDGSGSPSQCRRLGCRSFLRKARLAQAFVPGRNVVGDVLSKPFDGEARIDAKGFGDERLRLVHLAQERIGSGEVGVDPVGVIAGVERLSVFDDRSFGTTRANFYVAEIRTQDRLKWIMRAQPNRLLQVGFGLVETAQRYFCRRSGEVENRIDLD